MPDNKARSSLYPGYQGSSLEHHLYCNVSLYAGSLGVDTEPEHMTRVVHTQSQLTLLHPYRAQCRLVLALLTLAPALRVGGSLALFNF